MSTPPDGIELARRVTAAEVSPLELVDEAIARIERVDPVLNAVVSNRFDRARTEASSHRPTGPFAGVPFLAGDLGCTRAGEPAWRGTRGLRAVDHRPPVTSHLATAFDAAGFIGLGRTNTSEFGTMITTEPAANGPTRNPWHLDHSPGGSSGGSAAAVASGMVTVAHASDGGGSIRIPASACGLVGLKPSRGRVSSGPERAEVWGGALTELVVSRSVRDTAAVLDAVGRPMVGDPYWSPPPDRPFVEEIAHDPPRLRIGLVADHPDGGVHPECAAAVQAAGRVLDELGHVVTPDPLAALHDPAYRDVLSILIAVDIARDVDEVAAALGRDPGPDDVEPADLAMAETGRAVTGPAYLAALESMYAYGRRLATCWDPTDGYDVVCTPTLAGPPPRLGELTGPDGHDHQRDLLRFAAPFNATGQPAISLPLHRTDGGLPIGVQLVGRLHDEATLLALAAQLERARPWADSVPPVNGF